MKKAFNFIALLLFSMIFCGCYPTGQIVNENVESSKSLNEYGSDETKDISIENVDMDNILVYESDKNDSIASYKVTLCDYTGKDYITEIFPEKEVSDFYEDNDFNYKSYIMKDGSTFYVDNGNISFGLDPHGFNYCADISLFQFTSDLTRETFSKTELPGISSKNAENVFSSYLEDLEINNYMMSDYIAIDSDTFNELGITDQEGTIQSISDNEECYYFYANIGYDGIPILKSDYYSEYATTFGSYIRAIINNELKLIYFEARQIYNNYEAIETNEICNYNTAVNILKKYYASMEIEFPITFKSCQLAYAAYENSEDNTTYILKPVWSFVYQYTNEADMVITSLKLVDAVKGEIIL